MLSRLHRCTAAGRAPALARLAPRLGVAAPRALASAAGVSTPPAPTVRLVDELERLQHQTPWWQSGLLRLFGTFSDGQWQAAAGGDLYVDILQQAQLPELGSAEHAGLDAERYYTRLQLRGLHCWLAHVRLREEPKSSYEQLFPELMEKVWEQLTLDLSRDFGYGYVQLTKHLKQAQFHWHGSSLKLDEALAGEDDMRHAIAAVLRTNYYTDDEGEALPSADVGAPSVWLADYILCQVEHLKALPAEEVLKGRLTWAPPPPPLADEERAAANAAAAERDAAAAAEREAAAAAAAESAEAPAGAA